MENPNDSIALNAIRKKLVGKNLNYKEIYAIMDSIAKERMSDVLTTYFAASGYSKGFTDQELYYLTKAMVETGDKLEFKGIVADKHSIGGLPGTRTTMIVVPIVASAGFLIPKSSSRAITTPCGTADVMEFLADVDFSKDEIYKIVKKAGSCIVWGGALNLAPADDDIIRVEKPLYFESFDKILVSIMAKKIAFGSTHVVIDIPYGTTAKVHSLEDAYYLRKKFKMIAKKFNIKIECLIHKTEQPFGNGTGVAIEARDVLRVLQQKPNRSLDLELRSINLAGNLIELCVEDLPEKKKEIKEKYGNGFGYCKYLLESKTAWQKMCDIIQAQNGKPMDSEAIRLGKFKKNIRSDKKFIIRSIHSKNLTSIAKILGAPKDKQAGVYIYKKIKDTANKDDIILTLYSDSEHRLQEGIDSLINLPIIS